MAKVVIPKEDLYDLYVNQKFSFTRISNIYNCSPGTIKNRLRENNIPIRSRAESLGQRLDLQLGFSLTAEMIMEKVNEGMFIYEVADFYGINRKAITKKLTKAGINVSELGSHQKRMDEHNSRTSKEFFSDPDRYKQQSKWLKELREKRTEETQLRYDTAHLRDYQEYKKVCQRIVDKHYGKERPEGMQYDHKYSVRDGYDNGVPAPILSHPSNLRLISAWDNNSKGNGSIITTQELYEGQGLNLESSMKQIEKQFKSCDYCGSEFEPRNSKHRFCNPKCNKNWQYHNKKNDQSSKKQRNLL
ncbi:hypothetical protein [Halobacillus seohaensis]|uniref:HNH endonuclease n=1 Tax=Halobacillus seohaensis TaxID=447421 RepID=A0ABW2EP62_9BACI